MKSTVRLKQIHQLLSGLFISSASDGNISKSLELLLNPKHVPLEKVADVPAHLYELMLCAFKRPHTGKIEWCSYKNHKLMEGECVSYALSGLSAFPIPVWPFFGDNNALLNPFLHLRNYLYAYHQDIEVNMCSKTRIMLSVGSDVLFIYFDSKRDLICSAYVSSDSCLSLSFYEKVLGACIISSKKISSSNFCPINSIEKLDPLQYDGKIHFVGINRSTLKQSFSSFFI